MSAVALRQEAPMDRIHELIIAGEPSIAKELWLEIRQSVNGRNNRTYRLDCIRMRVEYLIQQFAASADPRIRSTSEKLQDSLTKFLRA
jgi:hypothetical protein